MSIAKVIIKEGILHREFHRPLSAPTSMPVPMATGKMAQVPRWEAAMAPKVAERAALAPTDRSVLPMAVTKSTPVPPMITGKAWLTMLEIFWGVTRVPRVAMRNTQNRMRKDIMGISVLMLNFFFMSSPQ